MKTKRAAVIGSGFGGLSVALRLQALGFQTKIYEKRDKPGGRAYVYEDKGFTFDAGPTVITDPTCLEELFTIHGKKLEDYVDLMPVSPLYRLFWEDGTQFDYTNDPKQTITEIKKLSPPDVENYETFLAYTKKVFIEGYEKLGTVPFLHFNQMMKAAPQLVSLKAYRSVYDVVSKFIEHPKLRQAFSFHSLLVGGNPFKSSAIYTLIHYLERKWGVFFPKGGTHALVRSLVKLFEENGGEIVYSNSVDQIVTHQGRVRGVRTQKGEHEAFDLVVSNADVMHTYRHLLKWEPRVEKRRRRLSKMSQSMSLFVMYFGTNKSFPSLAHHNVIFGKRYKELLDDIFDNGVLAEDFSLYLHNPSMSDPSLAPEGGHSFYVLSPVPHMGKANLDWNTVGPQYGDRILEYLDKFYMPGLRKSVMTKRIFTPFDFKNELNAHLGSAFSLEPLLTQSAWFRVHNRDPQVKGLYFVGAGTHPGAGLPGVVGSAKATAKVVADDWSDVKRIEKSTSKTQLVVPKARGAISQEVLENSFQKIQLGSKSFSLASKLFNSELRVGASLLYAFCRYCDDQVDEAVWKGQGEQRLKALRDKANDVYEGGTPVDPEFAGLKYLVDKYKIPKPYVMELLNGMEQDLDSVSIESFSDLKLYCYRVASTVGLMMCHIMGVSEPKALQHAHDLGLAMQLTNIARDVREDFEMGRVYLPQEWLQAVGITNDQLMSHDNRESLCAVVNKMLGEADKLYASGNEGLVYLSFRASLAVGAASQVYASIGHLVRQRGDKAWDRRCIVSNWGKAMAVVKGLWNAISLVSKRMTKPWKPVRLKTVWGHS